MIRITRLTDYGIILLAHIARAPEYRVHNVRDLAAEARLPLPTVSKILKALTKTGIVVSQRGIKGGYALARRPEEISVVDIIASLDGPIAITDCSTGDEGGCDHLPLCPVSGNWQRINLAVRDALQSITLADMIKHPENAAFVPVNRILGINGGTEVVELCQP